MRINIGISIKRTFEINRFHSSSSSIPPLKVIYHRLTHETFPILTSYRCRVWVREKFQLNKAHAESFSPSFMSLPHSMVVYLTKQLFPFLFRRESEWNNLHFMILLWKLFPTFPSFCDVVHCEILLLLSPLLPSSSLTVSIFFSSVCSLRDEKFIFLGKKKEKSQKSFFFSFWNEANLLHKPWRRNSSIYPSKYTQFFFIYSLSAHREWHLSWDT